MQRQTGRIALAALVGTAGLAGSFAMRSVAAHEAARPKTGAKSHKAVVVELFTSEGCSSCPPADILLQKLQEQKTVDGVTLIPLGEHVDYWNSIGWRDPFSSEAYTRRQRDYAQALRLNSVYTPQMVIDGESEFVGSDEDRAQDAITKAVRASKADVLIERITAKSDAGKASETTSDATPSAKSEGARLRVQVERVPRLSGGDTADVWLAITENKLRSNVTRGENAGRRLPHTAVTRLLKTIGSVRGEETFTREVSVTLDRGWKRADLSAVAFVQERNSKRIRGAAILPLAGE